MKTCAVLALAFLALRAFADPPAPPPPNLPIKLKLQWNAESDNLWIYAGVNGGHPVAYNFDTGSDAFLIAPSTWRAVRDPKPVCYLKTPEQMMYGDNTYGYDFFPVWAHLAFYNPGSGRPVLVLPDPRGYQVGKIVAEYTDYEPAKNIDVKSSAMSDTGVFGARMLISSDGDADSSNYQLSNPLLQIPGVEGYVVTDNGPHGTASVTVGLNKGIRDQFHQKITLTPNDGVFPGSNLHSCDESVVDLTFAKAGHSVTIQIGLGLDTGSSKGYSLALTKKDAHAVAAFLEDSNDVDRDKNTEVTKIVKVGTRITFSFPGRPDGFHYTFRSTRTNTRSNSGLMTVTVVNASYSDVTAGIGFFEHFSVMYDLASGELGFRDTPPDLSESILHPEGRAIPGATPPILKWPTPAAKSATSGTLAAKSG